MYVVGRTTAALGVMFYPHPPYMTLSFFQSAPLVLSISPKYISANSSKVCQAPGVAGTETCKNLLDMGCIQVTVCCKTVRKKEKKVVFKQQKQISKSPRDVVSFL